MAKKTQPTTRIVNCPTCRHSIEIPFNTPYYKTIRADECPRCQSISVAHPELYQWILDVVDVVKNDLSADISNVNNTESGYY